MYTMMNMHSFRFRDTIYIIQQIQSFCRDADNLSRKSSQLTHHFPLVFRRIIKNSMHSSYNRHTQPLKQLDYMFTILTAKYTEFMLQNYSVKFISMQELCRVDIRADIVLFNLKSNIRGVIVIVQSIVNSQHGSLYSISLHTFIQVVCKSGNATLSGRVIPN